jgi:hypothetical protein
MATKPKIFTYKIAEFDPENSVTLQAALQSAFRKVPRAMERRELITVSTDTYRFILNRQTHKGMLCGIFSGYTLGADTPTVDLNPNEENLTIASIAPTVADPSGRKQFLAGLLYFGIRGNHSIIVQSLRQRARAFEGHLNWLMRRADIVDEDDPQAIYLNNQIHPSQLARLNRVKNIVLSAPLDVDYAGGAPTPRPVGTVWKSLRDFLGKGTRLREGYRFSDAVNRGQIKAELSLTWNRGVPEDGTPLLDDVANVLRHNEGEVDYVINLNDGTKIKREDIQISTAFPINHISSDEADMRDLFDHMISWLGSLVDEKRIIV